MDDGRVWTPVERRRRWSAQACEAALYVERWLLGPDGPAVGASGVEDFELGLDDEVAGALVHVLTELPRAERAAFADRFYDERDDREARHVTRSPEQRLAAGAAIALLVVDLTRSAELAGPRVVDLLVGAAQGDDVSAVPDLVQQELRKVVARIRLDVELEDERDPRSAACTAVVEAIDPSGGTIDLYEILGRATWAQLHARGANAALRFLLAVDGIFASLAAREWAAG
jgi:hypothetical protein